MDKKDSKVCKKGEEEGAKKRTKTMKWEILDKREMIKISFASSKFKARNDSLIQFSIPLLIFILPHLFPTLHNAISHKMYVKCMLRGVNGCLDPQFTDSHLRMREVL